MNKELRGSQKQQQFPAADKFQKGLVLKINWISGAQEGEGGISVRGNTEEG